MTTSDPSVGGGQPEAVIVCPTPLGTGGLGAAGAEFADGMKALGHETAFIGPRRPSAISRLSISRPFRRAFGMAPHRRVNARAVRRAAVRGEWDLAFAMPGAAPIEHKTGICVVHQATRLPSVEWAALRRAEGETGGRGDLSRAESRRRELELRHADLIHVTTHAVHHELLEAGIPQERLVHSSLGVDLRRFSPAEKGTKLTVAFVGPLSMRKGVDVVADLAARPGEVGPIETVGGPTCPWSRRIATEANFLPRESVPEMLSTAHVLVLPSRSDGFAYVVLEALASGTVPVVTPEVGAAEIVRRLDQRLVIPRAEFVDRALELIPCLDFEDLRVRARALAEEFDRDRTSRAIAAGIIERAAERYPDSWPQEQETGPR